MKDFYDPFLLPVRIGKTFLSVHKKHVKKVNGSLNLLTNLSLNL